MTCVLHFGIQLIQVLVFVVIAVSSSCEPHKEGLQTKSNHKFQVLREMYNLALQTFAYGQTLQLRAVARADGKTLFADDTPRSWAASKDYCASWGMNLASITSFAQFLALDNAVETNVFLYRYWTAGRDSQQVSQFRWDATNTEVTANQIRFYQASINFQTCLLFDCWLDNKSVVYQEKCEMKKGVLCEI